ncbi:Tetratricopeptide repeat [Dillenia turbinata]|uniref:Tetratricopeptide repeat n=1 Tax=Dillenia turbinata TaxID=194707 RepID=A0AAN8V4N0_9MAGN
MPGMVRENYDNEMLIKEPSGIYTPYKEILEQGRSPKSPLSHESRSSDSIDLAMDAAVDSNSIEQLYNNICEMQSSDQSLSRRSFISYGDESRIDSELCHLVGGPIDILRLMKGEEEEKKENGSEKNVVKKLIKSQSANSKLPTESENSGKSSFNSKKPPIDRRSENSFRKGSTFSPGKIGKLSALRRSKLKNGIGDESGLDNPNLGPFLLKQTRDSINSGDNPHRSLELALRAKKSFEKCENGKPNLEMVMCLHVLAAIYCSLGQYNDAIPVLERSIAIPVIEEGETHALAKFAGCMQLGDTYAMWGQIENSILCYTAGLEIQTQVLGESDPRVGESCRYLAEAHVQAMQFDEAEKLCQTALDIHRENGKPASIEEAADRRLMGLICDAKGDHGAALEHFVLASMAMSAHGQEIDAATIDCSIGDSYLSLARYDEAVFSYQKALTVFKSTKGENHPSVASVFVRLADLYNKIGKFRESNSYCENALRIYKKPLPGTPPEETATGLIDISAICESMNELDRAIELLQKALKIYKDVPGQQSTTAGIEAQIGVMCYMMGDYSRSYDFLKSSIEKLRASGEKKSAFFAIALNQMGLACVQRFAINEAVGLFEEARDILEKECGQYHPDTLGVYSNLAGTYDAIGRLDDAIEILEYVVGMREEKLGTANPDVNDEKRRLTELLKEAGRVRSTKSRSLETLLDTNFQTFEKQGTEVL